jgi:hypothetical protein
MGKVYYQVQEALQALRTKGLLVYLIPPKNMDVPAVISDGKEKKLDWGVEGRVTILITFKSPRQKSSSS